jgi:hypothetical protein
MSDPDTADVTAVVEHIAAAYPSARPTCWAACSCMRKAVSCRRRGAQGLGVEAVDAFLQPLFKDVHRVVAKLKIYATPGSPLKNGRF